MHQEQLRAGVAEILRGEINALSSEDALAAADAVIAYIGTGRHAIELSTAKATIAELSELAKTAVQLLADIETELETAEATIASQRVWMVKRGHRGDCPAYKSKYMSNPHSRYREEQPGSCDCGLASVLGEGE